MSSADQVLQRELEGLVSVPTHDSWELAAIILYIVNGIEPDPNQIEDKIREAEGRA